MNTSPEPDDKTVDELTALLYEALQGTARGILHPGGPLDPTDLVHEAYVRLAHAYPHRSLSRPQFLALAATLIRRHLIDAHRKQGSGRGGGDWRRITSSEIQEITAEESVDLEELDEALSRLAEIDPGQARVVELRFFGGLTIDEVAKVMDISSRMVVKEWGMARAWLKREMER